MKKKVIVVLIVMFLFSGVGIGGYWHFSENKNKTEEITVGKNQNLIVAQISRINGNEITYAIAKEVDFSEVGSGKKENSSTEEDRDSQSNNKDTTGNENFGGRQSMSEEKRTGNMERGDMQEGEIPNDIRERNIPEGETSSNIRERNKPEGEMPSDMEQGEVSAESDKSEDSSSKVESRNLDKEKEETQRNKTMYTLTGEEETTLIPVGTRVTTQLGTTTTFSRLAAGDMVKLLVEKDKDGEDVVVGIWII
ncbi:MAG: hypothetical protein HFJ09_12775 [Lachnospiraceae bacterium]|nr:hypothetical protein [Lachnospiraceae bacterium]